MLRAQHRDLGFGDLRRRAAERAHELQDRLLTDELAPDAQQVEQRDVGLAEVALERPRIGEPRRPPHAQREHRRHAGAFRDLRKRRPGALGPNEPQRGHAEQPVLLDGLHDLGDRRTDLLGEEPQHCQPHVRVVGRPGRRARRRRSP